MAHDTYERVWNRVLLHCPDAGPYRAQAWVSYAFRELAEQRDWSWKLKRGQFIMPASYSTGTVTVTLASPTVTGSGTTWTAAMVGRQFRCGSSNPIYTIQSVDSATQITLDQSWGAATDTGASYEIYQIYVTPPDDFEHFDVVWDPSKNWKLNLHITQRELHAADAQRTNSGDACLVAHADYSVARAGKVYDTLQVVGTGPDPAKTSDSSYTGANPAIFTVEVTTGGATETAVFQWKKDSGSYTTGVTTASTPQALSDGVSIYWPTGETYVLGDTFVIRTDSSSQPGVPRYELWPHKKSAYVYPYLYWASPSDLEDNGAVIPANIRGDVLLEAALGKAAAWPGVTEKPNPYFNLTLSARHMAAAERMTRDLEVSDDDTYMRDLSYVSEIDWAPLPVGDSSWLQAHAV